MLMLWLGNFLPLRNLFLAFQYLINCFYKAVETVL
jgi:hypothetical protein